MTAVVVPFYVDRPAGDHRQPDDAPFDHPTRLHGRPTLPRLLDSLARLQGQAFDVVIVVGWVHDDVAPAAVSWARDLLESWSPPDGVGVYLMGERPSVDHELLSATSYSGIRNRCLLAGVLLDADSLVLLDDDEVVRDDALVRELLAPLDQGWDGNAGLYMEDGQRVVVPAAPTAATPFLDTNGPRLAAFEALLAHGQAVDAPFAFGGNLALSSRLFRRLPFDPLVPRGEDVDYVLSARLRGHRIQIDPAILVDHHAPPRRREPWRQLWIDGWRFLAQRRKLACARDAGCPALDLDPYPGRVLSDDLGPRLGSALRALGAPEPAVAGLAAWEHELTDADPWADYLYLADDWRALVGGLGPEDADTWLTRVEGP